jgi:hypothetical protein
MRNTEPIVIVSPEILATIQPLSFSLFFKVQLAVQDLEKLDGRINILCCIHLYVNCMCLGIFKIPEL